MLVGAVAVVVEKAVHIAFICTALAGDWNKQTFWLGIHCTVARTTRTSSKVFWKSVAKSLRLPGEKDKYNPVPALAFKLKYVL